MAHQHHTQETCSSCSHHHEHQHEHKHEHKHEHHHEHHHGDGLHRQLLLIIASGLLLASAVLIEHYAGLDTWQLLLVYLVPYLLIGHETLHEAVEGLTSGHPFNEHLLMSVATIGALCIGFLPGAETQFPEAVFVMLFFQVGELFEGYAEGKSRDSIAHLMDIRPDVAHVGDREVSPEEVSPGEIITVRPGERIPLDGIITEGTSTLNTVALTGESLPRSVTVGDEAVSGCINLTGVLLIRTTKTFGESTASKIIALVESAREHKSRSENLVTRFARIYTPIVVAAAITLVIIPPLLSFSIYHLSFSATLTTWLYRALMFLVVSCPCALVISVPLTFFGGIGGASRRGILIKGANYMDTLSRVDTVVFDKTGTLTKGEFAVTAVHPTSNSQHPTPDTQHLLHLAAHVEHHSTHPIGAALRDAFPEEATDGCAVSDVEERAGQGICATVEGHRVCVGNTRLMEAMGTTWSDCPHDETVIHVAIDGQYAGHIAVGDHVKEDSAEAIRQLRDLGIHHTVMLTGDREETASAVAQQLGISDYHAGLMPADKVSMMKSIGSQSKAFVGDGINDAPVLALADVGIAMGGLGSDAAIEAADVVIMDDHPSKVAEAIRISRRTLAIARQNIGLAIGIKVAVLLLATCGLATMWLAVFADVGVTVLAVLNAMRALHTA